MRAPLPSLTLADELLLLREWTPADAPALAAACDDDDITYWLDHIPRPFTVRDARDYLTLTRRGWRDGSMASFAVVERFDTRPVGSISISWLETDVGEVGYWISREVRGRGFATRAVRLAARWAIEQRGVQRLQLRADVRNEASRRVAEKAGFTLEGILRSSRYSERQGRRIDFALYSLLPTELHR